MCSWVFTWRWRTRVSLSFLQHLIMKHGQPWCRADFSCRSENLLPESLGPPTAASHGPASLAEPFSAGPMEELFLEMITMAQENYLRSFSNIIKVCVLQNRIRRLMHLWVSQWSGVSLVYCTQFSDSCTFHGAQKHFFFFFFNKSYRKSIDFMSSINSYSFCVWVGRKQRNFHLLIFGTKLPHCCLDTSMAFEHLTLWLPTKAVFL